MRWILLVLAGLLAPTMAPATARAWPAEFDHLDGDTLRVELRLQRAWNLVAEELLLGRPAPPRPAGGGGAWLLDLQLAELWFLPPAGAPRGPFGRSGEGPGEWGMPADLCLGPEGEPWVLSLAPTRIVAPRAGIDPAPPAPRLGSAGRLPLGLAWADGHGGLRWQGLRRQGDGLRREWGLLRWSGERVDTLSVAERPFIPGRVDPAGADDAAPWAMLAGGVVVEAPRWDEYRLVVHRPGEAPTTIRREQSPRPWVRPPGVEIPDGLSFVEPPCARVVRGLHAAGPWLLVQTAHGGARGFDLFGPPGLSWKGHLELVLPPGLGREPRLVAGPDGWWLLDPEGVGHGPLVAELR